MTKPYTEKDVEAIDELMKKLDTMSDDLEKKGEIGVEV